MIFCQCGHEHTAHKPKFQPDPDAFGDNFSPQIRGMAWLGECQTGDCSCRLYKAWTPEQVAAMLQ